MYRYIFNLILTTALLTAVLAGCGQKRDSVEQRQESREAKQLLQGVWADEETDAVVFKMKGDSVFYADSTSMPAYFKVVDDTLCIGDVARYHIEKQTEHVLWFRNQNGELAKFVKTDEDTVSETFQTAKPQILTLTEVLKRDTVVFHDGERYHCYVAINPTRYKVAKRTINDDGLEVENVYYDNIIHISIFHGSQQLFSRDFRKQGYAQQVPQEFLQQAVLNDMQFVRCDKEGFLFQASLCVPDEAGCYMVGNTISLKGQLSTKLLEN